MSIPPCDLSIAEFCEMQGFSLYTYKTLREKGLAPEEFAIPGTRVTRITAEAHQAWLKRMTEPDVQMAEHLRRMKRGRRYGKLSLKSPDHPQNVWARLKQ